MLTDAIGSVSGVGRGAAIDPCGEPLVFERNLPQALLDCRRRRFAGQLSNPSRVAAIIFGRKRWYG